MNATLRSYRRAAIGLLSAATLLGAAPASAATYVQFADGRALEVQAYKIHRTVIELDLGEGSRMVLPLDGVEWIERNGRGMSPAVESRNAAATAGPPLPASAESATSRPGDRDAAVGRRAGTGPSVDRIDYTAPFIDRGAAVALRPDRLRRGRDPRSPSP